MKKDFQQLKKEFSDLCKKHSACKPEFERLLKTENEKDFLQVIYDNLSWCISEGIITHEFFSYFDQSIFMESGIANSGKENTGFVNSGNWNSGYRNSGNWNSGYRNSGDRNSGNWNSGYRNSGNWNSGDRNSGDSNSGYRNSGAFSTDANPFLVLFDKPTNIRVRDWEQMEACQLMYGIDNNIWVPMSIMSEKEKEANPHFETTEGYLKTIPIKEAWANFWGNLKEDKKAVFTSLPNFDAEKFEEITGIKI